MTAMQLIPPEFSKLFSPPRARNVEAVFYVGCNALRTPHLLFNTMYVLDALEIDYEVVGGPSSCCGVIHAKWEGDVQTGERVTTSTTSYFGGFAPERVLNWCPTCELHLGETTKGFGERSYDFGHVTAHFVSRLDDLKKKFTNPIPKRVVLHAHTGYEQVGLDVARLLATIPQLEVVETVYESGYTCGGSGCSKCPELQTKEHGELLARMADTGADVLVTLYHGCHMAFVAEERKGQFEVLNFTDLMAQALGVTPHEDRLKHYGLLSDWKLIAAEAQPYLHANGLDFDSDWIERQLPHLFTGSEFKGDEGCAPFPERRAAKIHFDRGSKSQ